MSTRAIYAMVIGVVVLSMDMHLICVVVVMSMHIHLIYVVVVVSMRVVHFASRWARFGVGVGDGLVFLARGL